MDRFVPPVIQEFIERGDARQAARSSERSRTALLIRGVVDNIDTVKLFDSPFPPFAGPPFVGVVDKHVEAAKSLERQAVAEYEAGFVARTQIGASPQTRRASSRDFSPTLSNTPANGGPAPLAYMPHPLIAGEEPYARAAASHSPPGEIGTRSLTLPEDIRGSVVDGES